MQPELGILADDLTGATDTGLQFAKCGRRTRVSLNLSANAAGDVLVFDSDSRLRPMAEARQRVVVASQKLRAAGAQRFYKKIDSTGRGNLGVEIAAMLEALGQSSALICPAFPPLGRTVRDGAIHLRGVPLDQTEFARDPVWPATTASLAEILGRQTDLPIDSLSLAEVRRGPVYLRDRIQSLSGAGVRLIVADAESAIDLRCLVEAVRQVDQPILPVGSAGLAEWLTALLARPARAPREVGLGHDPILVVAGTVNRVGVVQLARLIEEGAGLARVPLDLALGQPERAARDAAAEVARLSRGRRCVVLTLTGAEAVADASGLRELARGQASGLVEVTERLVDVLGQAARLALEALPPAALILTGGDTARAVCVAIGAHGLDVYREAAPGVPISLLEGGRWDGLPVVTKAGGFGEPGTLSRVVQELEEMRR